MRGLGRPHGRVRHYSVHRLSRNKPALAFIQNVLAPMRTIDRLDSHSKSIHIAPTMITITPTQLRKAADIQEKIQSLQNELNEILGGEVPILVQAVEAPAKPGKRKMSSAGRAAIAAAARARWAKIKGVKAGNVVQKPKRKMSAEGLANIRAGVAKRMTAPGRSPNRKGR